MTPLRIEIDLVGPVERPARPIHLDSLIANLMVTTEIPRETDVATIRAHIERLPLGRADVGGDWVWQASSVAFDWTTPPMQEFATRAIRPEAVAGVLKTGMISNFGVDTKIDVARGQLKSATYAHEFQWARSGVAYCIGDRARLEELLDGLESIGARRRLGNGQVSAVRVVPDAAAASLWKRRYLPQGAVEGRMVEGAYRLPLFDRTHQRIVRDNHLEWDGAVAA